MFTFDDVNSDKVLSVKDTNLVETVTLKSFHILGTKGVALFRLLMTARPYRVHFGGFFALKQWISSSLKHDTVPRVNNLYYCIALWDGFSTLSFM